MDPYCTLEKTIISILGGLIKWDIKLQIGFIKIGFSCGAGFAYKDIKIIMLVAKYSYLN